MPKELLSDAVKQSLTGAPLPPPRLCTSPESLQRHPHDREAITTTKSLSGEAHLAVLAGTAVTLVAPVTAPPPPQGFGVIIHLARIN